MVEIKLFGIRKGKKILSKTIKLDTDPYLLSLSKLRLLKEVRDLNLGYLKRFEIVRDKQ